MILTQMNSKQFIIMIEYPIITINILFEQTYIHH